MTKVQDAGGRFSSRPCVDDEEVRALSAEEAAGSGAGGAAGDAAHHAAAPRPRGHEALSRLSP